MAQGLAQRIRKNIIDQIYDWPGLSPSYLRWKQEQGLDTRMLIAYGYYINAIEAWETPRGVKVGIRNWRMHPAPEGEAVRVNMRDLGRWLEYGTYNKDGSIRMPPRPHFRPAILFWKNNELGPYKEKVRAQMTKEAQKRLNKDLATLRHRVKHGH